ncbi:MAG: LytTR family DNA-binding domain-containing protein [Bacteroidota bacterium]
MNALIIDDEPLAHLVLLEYAKDLPFLNIVGQCHLATEALTFLEQEQVDLIFLDINMPKLKGLDFLRTLAKPPLVIVTSAYEEYALESYELSVCDYLLKPFRYDRFLKAVNQAKARYMTSSPSVSAIQEDKKDDSFFIKSDKRTIQIRYEEIYFLESYGNYVKIWLHDQFHLTPQTLSSFEAKLPSTFYRIHKSFIVQLPYIDYIEGNQVMMKNEKSLPIGKSYRAGFKALLNKS